jgi:hypothetical protein
MTRPLREYGAALIAVCSLAACSTPQEPARHAVDNVQAAVKAAAAAGQQYFPEQFASLQTRSAALKNSYDRGDFKLVLNQTPTLLNDIQAMTAAAAARRAAADKLLSGEWQVLAGSIPGQLSAVQERLDSLSTDKKEAARADVAGAKAELDGLDEQWSHAQEVFNSGDLAAAVATARSVQTHVDAAARSLRLELPDISHS